MTSVFHELSNSLKSNFTDGKQLQVGEEQSDLFMLSLLFPSVRQYCGITLFT